MADPHVITALVKRRSELSGDIETTQKKLQQMILDLEHLDQTLLMFDPDYRIETIKPKAFRPPEDWSKRGQMSRMILGMLRQAKKPMTVREIALQVMAQRSLDVNNQVIVRMMLKRCGVALRGMRDRGITKSEEGPGQCVLWDLF